MTEQKSLAIMFVDVRGSTRLYEVYGDVKGRQLTAWSIKTFSDIVAAQGGQVIKTMGDGAMATLPSATAALITATTTQEAHSNSQVTIGIGFQIGTVILENNDVFGDAVNVAARLCSLAKSGEILTTEEAIAQVPAMLRGGARHMDTTTVKGRREPLKIYQVISERDEDTTVTVMSAPQPRAAEAPKEARMVLVYSGQNFVMKSTTESFSLGRVNCDVTVSDTLVSRVHAKIEYRHGKWVLLDQSTNGTFVTFAHGASQLLKREEIVMSDSGAIGLGRAPGDDNEHTIAFTFE